MEHSCAEMALRCHMCLMLQTIRTTTLTLPGNRDCILTALWDVRSALYTSGQDKSPPNEWTSSQEVIADLEQHKCSDMLPSEIRYPSIMHCSCTFELHACTRRTDIQTHRSTDRQQEGLYVMLTRHPGRCCMPCRPGGKFWQSPCSCWCGFHTFRLTALSIASSLVLGL